MEEDVGSRYVKGTVTWGESSEPVAGVMISNGVDVTLSDESGNYTLPFPAWKRHVFITVPFGASCDQFFHTVPRDPGESTYDFVLSQLSPTHPGRSHEQIRFLHLTDTHISPEHFGDGDQLASDLKVLLRDHAGDETVFTVVTGDLTDTGVDEEFQHYLDAWSDYPHDVYHLPGNHDYFSPDQDEPYRRIIGPPYYAFESGPFHFVCYDSAGDSVYGPGYAGRRWLLNHLRLVPQDRPIIIFSHFPVDRLLADLLHSFNVRAVFGGHWHAERVYEEKGITFYSTPCFSFSGIDYSPRGFRAVTLSFDPKDSRTTVEAKRHYLTSEGVHGALFPRDDESGTAELPLLWETPLPHRPSLLARPVVREEKLIVVVESTDEAAGGVVCINRMTGHQVWYAPLDGMIKGSAAISDGRVIVTTLTGRTVCLAEETGDILWSHQLNNPLERWIYHHSGIYKGCVVVCSPVQIVCLDLYTGRVRWEQVDIGVSDWICSVPSPVFHDDVVYIGFLSQRVGLMALHIHDGRELWRHAAGFRSLSNGPYYDQGRLYVIRHAISDQLECFDMASHELLWRVDLGDRWCAQAPVAVGKVIVVTVSTGHIQGYDKATGDRLWEWEAPCGTLSVTPYRRDRAGHVGGTVVWRGCLIVAGLDGSLMILSPETGQVLRQFQAGTLGRAPITAPPAIVDDMLITLDLSGTAKAFVYEL